MERDREKILLLYSLEDRKIIRELCPVPTSDYRNTAYWHYEVLRPELLPESLVEEFERLGELR